MKKSFTVIFLPLLLLINPGCNSSPRPFEINEQSSGGQTRTVVSCRDWSVHFPAGWKPVYNGVTAGASVIQLSKNKEGPTKQPPLCSCLLACEAVGPNATINEYVLGKFTKITAQMIRSGYGVDRVRDDFIAELTVAGKKQGSITGFAYELKAPASLKNRRTLAIALFTMDGGSVLSLSFEMGIKSYPLLKDEIKSIMTSLYDVRR